MTLASGARPASGTTSGEREPARSEREQQREDVARAEQRLDVALGRGQPQDRPDHRDVAAQRLVERVVRECGRVVQPQHERHVVHVVEHTERESAYDQVRDGRRDGREREPRRRVPRREAVARRGRERRGIGKPHAGAHVFRKDARASWRVACVREV